MKTMRFLLFFVTSYLYLCQMGMAQGDYYAQNYPFDSSGIFREKVVLDFGAEIKRIPKDKIYQLSPRYIDSLSLEKIEYLRTQLVDNPNLVIVALLYDGFHMKEGHETYGWHSTPERAKRILARLFRKDINWNRVAFFYSDCTPGGHTHEHLLSTDRRLELLVYELLLE